MNELAVRALAAKAMAVHSTQDSGGSGISKLLGDLTGVISGLYHLAGGAASGAAGDLFGLSAGAILKAVGDWVTSGAMWLLEQVGAVMTATTQADVGSSWFGARLSIMSELAVAVMLPMMSLRGYPGHLQAERVRPSTHVLREPSRCSPLHRRRGRARPDGDGHHRRDERAIHGGRRRQHP